MRRYIMQEKELIKMANLIPIRRHGGGLTATGFEDFYNMLDDFFTEPFSSGRRGFDAFKLDVQQMDDVYLIEAELPGAKKDEISVDLADGTLRIALNREESKDEQSKNYIHKERRSISPAAASILEMRTLKASAPSWMAGYSRFRCRAKSSLTTRDESRSNRVKNIMSASDASPVRFYFSSSGVNPNISASGTGR